MGKIINLIKEKILGIIISYILSLIISGSFISWIKSNVWSYKTMIIYILALSVPVFTFLMILIFVINYLHKKILIKNIEAISLGLGEFYKICSTEGIGKAEDNFKETVYKELGINTKIRDKGNK